jgi:hypothetical protein
MAKIRSLNTIVTFEVTPSFWQEAQGVCNDADKQQKGTAHLVGLRLAVASEIWGSPYAKDCDDVSVGYRKVTLRYLAHDGMHVSEINAARLDLQERVERVVQAAMKRLDAAESEQTSERIAQA